MPLKHNAIGFDTVWLAQRGLNALVRSCMAQYIDIVYEHATHYYMDIFHSH